MGTTDDRDDPALHEIGPSGMQKKYLVLSEAERAKGFVRPVRKAYKHQACGAHTTMGTALAETYARQPDFYGATMCVHCQAHFPVGAAGEFVWVENGWVTNVKVGT